MIKKEITFNSLDSSFLNTNNMTLNIDYLKESIELTLYNTRKLYNLITDSRMKNHSIIWQSFISLTNELIENIYFPKKYQCSSEHLKSYLKKYGYDYKECFIDIIENLKNYKEELTK